MKVIPSILNKKFIFKKLSKSNVEKIIGPVRLSEENYIKTKIRKELMAGTILEIAFTAQLL